MLSLIFPYHRPNLVRDTTCAIWCSSRGMSEQELISFLQVRNPRKKKHFFFLFAILAIFYLHHDIKWENGKKLGLCIKKVIHLSICV